MKNRHSGPQIVAKLRQADVLIGQANGQGYQFLLLYVQTPAFMVLANIPMKPLTT